MKSRSAGVLGVLAILLVWTGGCSSSKGSGSGVKPSCAKTEFTCRCENEPFTLDTGETATDDCSSFTSSTWRCTFDLDTSGQSTSCECAKYACALNGDDCVCDFATPYGTVVSSCDLTDVGGDKDATCCVYSNQSCQCNNNGIAHGCVENGTSCSTSSYVEAPAPEHTAPTCRSVVWKAPSTSSGGGGGETSKPDCTSDSQCSSSCGGDCYECSSGSCNCGYEGSDGCVF